MSLLGGAVALVWLGAYLARRNSAPKPQAPRYVLGPGQNAALALAHPQAVGAMDGGFADEVAPRLSDNLVASLRRVLLHELGLRAELDDAALKAALPQRLASQWYRLTLDKLRDDDDPRAALAFACARVTFLCRTAALIGWLDEASEWQILQLNLLRASECFGSWQDYGSAWARGRRQWVANSRADSLGQSFSEQDVARWVKQSQHPWHDLPWPTPQQAAAWAIPSPADRG
ncbi:DUF1266 domain-containing protein [Chitinimonas sp.]|uniref:DUF1266 domain-containing protein n=1 Tax=Chitinimonas sp. TaxID=1934313 RepID=UPI0035B4CEB3